MPAQRRKPRPVGPTIEGLAAQLRAMANPARARSTQRFFKEPIVALGIATPAFRAALRAPLRGLAGEWQPRQAVAACERLLAEPEFEVRAAGVALLGAFHRQLTTDVLPRAERWLERRLDNWALVDGFCAAVSSPLLARLPEVGATLRRWSQSRSLWVRRASLVTLVPLARRGSHLALTYGLARAHFGDPEDLMHKATGWLLREAGKGDAARLKRFLLQHGPAIPRTAVRYAIERFPAAERARLLAATRP